MLEPGAATVAVTINVPPSAEDRLTDWLLGRAEVAGFTSAAAYGHGANAEELTVAEQVTGRQRRVEVRLEIGAEGLDAFLVALTAAFAAADVYYFVTPVLRSGHLRRRLL